jgi:hypothetical protein
MERMAAYASARRKAQPASLFGDFCNKIGTQQTCQPPRLMSAFGVKADVSQRLPKQSRFYE